MASFDISKVKLIIWDLDDTFWSGTISEGEVVLIEKNMELVKAATDCGIIHSICSKNEYAVAKEQLMQAAVWDFFVCPSINWESKGTRVQQQIADLQLRDENVLFIDDNIGNINEVLFYNPNIMTAQPDDLEEIYTKISTLPKKDLKHERLARYKIIEKKLHRKETANSNLEFLRDCNIKVVICSDCLAQIERIHELLLRTNQLNYTKNRASLEELTDDLKNAHNRCGYVKVSDDYGDYGIVGFFCLGENGLKHFAFSCRCMGMGIEQYVYAELGFPQITVVGQVAVMLDNTKPDWINVVRDSHKKDKAQIDGTTRILLKGPCDMSQIFSFIKENENIDAEFTYTSENGVSIEQHNHTQCIIQSLSMDDQTKDEILRELPFGDKGMYKQSMFERNYHVVVLSLLSDGGMGLYKRKTGEYVAFSEYIHPLTDEKEWEGYITGKTPRSNCSFTRQQLQTIKENYEYIGRITPQQVVENVKSILEHLNKDTYLILLLGSEIPFLANQNPNYQDRHLFHKELNDKIKQLALSEKRLKYIEFTKYIRSQNDFFDNINHFMKHIYYGVSKEMLAYINELTDVKVVREGFIVLLKSYAKQLARKLLRNR